jgi:hypothetical protein
VEQVMAVRALNLPSGQLLIALEVLPAMRTRKLEFTHSCIQKVIVIVE